MSSFIIVGFLGLTSGRRVRSDVTRPDGSPLVLWHVFYDTCIICSQPPSLPAELRKYSPISDIVYPDDTVAFVVAKAYVPPVNFSKTVLLDAILMIPVPGDPSSIEYDERVPDLCTPLVFGIGTVAAAQDSAPNTPVYFPTTVSDFVRGSPKQTVIQYVLPLLHCSHVTHCFFFFSCRLDKSIARWRNVPTPNRGALICFLGTCFQLLQSGHLCVDLLNIVFLANTPSTPPQTVTGDLNAASSSVSRKRRKFAARTATDASDISLESPTRSSMNASVANVEGSSSVSVFVYAFLAAYS